METEESWKSRCHDETDLSFTQLTTLELMQLAEIPKTIDVLFSLQVGVSEFQVGGKVGEKAENYGDGCWTRAVLPFGKSCGQQYTIDLVDKDLVLVAKQQNSKFKPPILFDNTTTMEMKINLMFGRVQRRNLGWSLHRIEMDYIYGECTLPDVTPTPLIVSHVRSVVSKHRRLQWD
nr:uncharacterized protein LOC126534853 [Dermacentor andersoni]